MLSPVTAITAGVVVFALGWRVLRCPIQLTVLNDDRHVRRNDHPHGVSFLTVMNVWDNPEAIADFFIERTRPIIEEMGGSPGQARATRELNHLEIARTSRATDDLSEMGEPPDKPQ